jgi:Caudoviral major tail protein N-terminus
MATVPLSGTDIRLLSGIPFSNDYKHTRWFDTVTDQMAYFNSKPIVYSLAEYNFQRIEGKSFIAVDKSIDDLWNVNYVMFRNTAYDNKWFFAFVTKLEYKQRNNTWIHFEIDVFQTWKFDMNFKPSYIAREHCPLWNTDGSPVANTVDEGLNYGSEYDVVDVERYVPFKDIYFLVIVSKSLIHDREGGVAGDIFPTINASPQPLCYYVHPFKLDGSNPYAMINGEEAILSTPIEVLKAMFKFDDTVNNIVSLYVTDFTGLGMTYDGTTEELHLSPNNFHNVNIREVIDGTETYLNTLFVYDVKQYTTKEDTIGSRWHGYNGVSESKLLMSPYTQLILSDFRGNQIQYKNEYFNSNDLKMLVKGSLGTSNKVSYSFKGYNFNAEGFENEMSNETALINNDPNDLPILTDMLSAYLQGNRNSIMNQYNSALFNGIMGSAGGLLGGIASSPSPVGVVSGAMNMVSGAGNSVLQMQGLQAKHNDISNTPPSISKMGSNTAYNTGNQYNGVYIIKKQIKQEYRKKLSDFFNMYGYKLNEVKQPNFHTRQNWNYIQTIACNITGNFNNDDLNELKSIFDNGITLWHTDDIGNYSLENGVI